MTTVPSPSQLTEITADIAARRNTSNPSYFMAQYVWWTARASGLPGLEDEPHTLQDPVAEAAQIEAYAAARRRAAYRHSGKCVCAACEARHDCEQRARLTRLRAA